MQDAHDVEAFQLKHTDLRRTTRLEHHSSNPLKAPQKTPEWHEEHRMLNIPECSPTRKAILRGTWMSTSLLVAPMVTRARAIVSKSRVAVDISNASTAIQVPGDMRPTMPKSMNPSRPLGCPGLSSSTSRLPSRHTHFQTLPIKVVPVVHEFLATERPG